ncbi:lipase family alpha/beta hydrolase [Rhodohalobacter sp. 614A]|uniref:lipase family alpha/beta hydrolase n=1 Tax=Rhodohalobacter sp. 614A TaxID=2908649 RepID=UPI001F2EA6FF|nr:hypothetical protein [Rhodohalobacter sp. 614A]
MSIIQPPYYPIIYVRGFAMMQSEIEDTVATPYMGFNLGSTKIRQEWDGDITKHIFESPLIRLMKDYGYLDNYLNGIENENSIPAKSIIIHRYYDTASKEMGYGERPSIIDAAEALGKLVEKVKNLVCGDNSEAHDDFKVYLVAHSMGGLICRCFLQNEDVSSAEVKSSVDKVFTYGTPHNGIEVRGMNVPGFLDMWDINNFNRDKMATYLHLDNKKQDEVNSLGGKFDPSRFFCLVGTNHKDYIAAKYAVGAMSDGLVKIKNASVAGSPRAYTHHSHSGHFGMVNSEEGYQNLVRFLFGNTLVKAILEPTHLPLPPSVKEAYDADKDIKASYFFESTVAPRGAYTYKLSERKIDHSSAVFRTFDELLRPDKLGRTKPRLPVLFSVFLDSSKITHGRTLVFTIDLVVRTTEYRIDRILFLEERIPEENLYREKLTVRATITNDGWNIRYIPTDEEWGEKRGKNIQSDGNGVYIPLSSRKGFEAKLYLDIQPWK